MRTGARLYWFPAKRWGWGWGFPASWQGWLAFGVFGALIPIGIVLFPPARMLGLFIGYMVVISLGLVAVCWTKGEPPRWRWGGE